MILLCIYFWNLHLFMIDLWCVFSRNRRCSVLQHNLRKIAIKNLPEQDNVRTNTESVQCHHVFDTAYLVGARFTGSCDVVDYVTNRFAIGQFLLVVHWNRSSIYCRFKIFASKYIWLTILTFWGRLMLSVMWDNGPQTFWSHDPDLSRSHVWRHRSRDHLTPHTPFPIHAPLWPSPYFQPFSRYWVLKIIGSRPWPF